MNFAAPLNLFEAHRAIKNSSADSAGAIGYMPRVFCIHSLPHLDPKANFYNRVNGRTQLDIIGTSNCGLPFGRISRLLLIWLTTQAIHQKNSTNDLDHHQSEFFKKALGIGDSGGANGTIARYADHLTRLLRCRVQIQDERRIPFKFTNYLIAQSVVFATPATKRSMPIRFTLDLDFYNYITKDAVPIDIRAVRALQSSYALDLYLFFASTLPGLRSSDQMTWLELLEQLGYSQSHEKNGAYRAAKSRLLKHVNEVSSVYPRAGIELQPSCLVMQRSEASA